MLHRRKYVDIAYGNPRGVMLREIIQAHWGDWLACFKQYSVKLRGSTNFNPEKIYTDMVWYIGVCDFSLREIAKEVAKEGYPASIISHRNRDYPECFLIFDNWLENLLFRLLYQLPE